MYIFIHVGTKIRKMIYARNSANCDLSLIFTQIELHLNYDIYTNRNTFEL